MMNVDFDSIAGDVIIPVVEFLFDGLARQHAARVAHQQFQQGELFGFEHQRFALQRGDKACRIERHLAVTQLAARLSVAAALLLLAELSVLTAGRQEMEKEVA